MAVPQPPTTTTSAPSGVVASPHGETGKLSEIVFVTVFVAVSITDTVRSAVFAT